MNIRTCFKNIILLKTVDNMENSINKILKSVVKDLLEGNYQKITDKSYEKVIKKSEWIKDEIDGYPGKLTLPPDWAFQDLNIVQVTNQNKLFLDFYLWVDNEKSDLKMKIILYPTENEVKFTFYDILVP